jgi:hypothetical protein
MGFKAFNCFCRIDRFICKFVINVWYSSGNKYLLEAIAYYWLLLKFALKRI